MEKHRKLFKNPFSIFMRMPGFYDHLAKTVRMSIKDSVSREDFVELLERTGLDQADMRDLTKKYEHIFYSEYGCTQERKLLDGEGNTLLGPVVHLEPAQDECCCVGVAPATIKQLQQSLIDMGCTPKGKKKADLLAQWEAESLSGIEVACTCGANTSNEYDMIDMPRMIKGMLPALLMPQLQPDENDSQDVMKGAKQAKEILAAAIERVTGTGGTAREIERMQKKLVKLEEGIADVNRKGMFDGVNLYDVKENCTGTLIHRQPLAGYEHIEVVVKLTADGRLIYRMLETQESSSQTAYTVKFANSAHKANSVHNTFCIGAHNGKDSLENMSDALKKINQWKQEFDNDLIQIDDEILLPNPNVAPGEPEYVRVRGLTAKVRLVLCLDGATQFSLCPETCGPGSKMPCNRCGARKDRHTKGEFCENIGMVCELIKIRSGETTKQELANRFLETVDLIDQTNCPSNHLREIALQDLTLWRGEGGSATDAAVGKEPMDLSKFGPNEVICWDAVGPKEQFVRVRLVWPQDRAICPELSAFTWEDVLLCSLHCRLRMTEAKVFNLERDCVGTNRSAIAAYTLMLKSEGIKYTPKIENGALKRPKFQGYQAREFLKDSATTKGKKKYEVLIEKLEPGTDAKSTLSRTQTLEVWKSFETLMTLVDLQYPSKEQQELIAALTMEHMLAFRMKYGPEDVTYYLHTTFAHATQMMRKHKSIGLYKNESDECLHSEDKAYTQDHTHRGGCGIPLLKELMIRWRRKLTRAAKPRVISRMLASAQGLAVHTWEAYKNLVKSS